MHDDAVSVSGHPEANADLADPGELRRAAIAAERESLELLEWLREARWQRGL